MTSMKRTSVSFPDDLYNRVFSLRKDDRFTRYSYSDLIRMLTERGLDLIQAELEPPESQQSSA